MWRRNNVANKLSKHKSESQFTEKDPIGKKNDMVIAGTRYSITSKLKYVDVLAVYSCNSMLDQTNSSESEQDLEQEMNRSKEIVIDDINDKMPNINMNTVNFNENSRG